MASCPPNIHPSFHTNGAQMLFRVELCPVKTQLHFSVSLEARSGHWAKSGLWNIMEVAVKLFKRGTQQMLLVSYTCLTLTTSRHSAWCLVDSLPSLSKESFPSLLPNLPTPFLPNFLSLFQNPSLTFYNHSALCWHFRIYLQSWISP